MLRNKLVTCLQLQSKFTAALKQNSSLPISNLTRVKHLLKKQHCVNTHYPNRSGEEDKKHQSAVYHSSEPTCVWNDFSFRYLPRPDPGSRVPQAIAKDAAAPCTTGSLFSPATSLAAVSKHIILNSGLSKSQGEIFVSDGVLNNPEEQSPDTKMLASLHFQAFSLPLPTTALPAATALLCNDNCINKILKSDSKHHK